MKIPHLNPNIYCRISDPIVNKDKAATGETVMANIPLMRGYCLIEWGWNRDKKGFHLTHLRSQNLFHHNYTNQMGVTFIRLAWNDSNDTCSLLPGRSTKTYEKCQILSVLSSLGPFHQSFGQVMEWLILKLHEIKRIWHAIACPMIFVLAIWDVSTLFWQVKE